MPLPLVFDTILEQLYDHGATDTITLARLAEEKTKKRERLTQIYTKVWKLDGDPWLLFTLDILEQMQDGGFIARIDDSWKIGENFRLTERLIILPARKGKSQAIGARIFEPKIRELYNQVTMQRLELASLAADLNPDGPGMRKVDPKKVEELAQSMRDYGYMPQFPILVDQHDRILTGRHRLAAAKLVGVEAVRRVVEVSDDSEAVAIAYVANACHGWSKAERDAIERRLRACGGINATQPERRRTLIRALLVENPTRSNAEIARQIGCSDTTVGTVRKELEAASQIGRVDVITGADNKMYPVGGRKADPESTRAKVLEAVTAAGDAGLTLHEAQAKLPDVHAQTIGSALNTLAKQGVISNSGEKRREPGRGGRPPTVYVAKPHAPEPEKFDAEYEDRFKQILKLFERLPDDWQQKVREAICR
jgi:predicted ArsR family transcriptional regulator